MVIRSRKETIGALDHNYEILSYMFALGIRSAKLDELCALGFSPETVCSHRKSAGGHNEYSCYDLVYDQTDVKIFNLRKKDIIREKSPSVPRDKR